jgi:hypothetical protein
LKTVIMEVFAKFGWKFKPQLSGVSIQLSKLCFFLIPCYVRFVPKRQRFVSNSCVDVEAGTLFHYLKIYPLLESESIINTQQQYQ